jgi:hypothetical protein
VWAAIFVCISSYLSTCISPGKSSFHVLFSFMLQHIMISELVALIAASPKNGQAARKLPRVAGKVSDRDASSGC